MDFLVVGSKSLMHMTFIGKHWHEVYFSTGYLNRVHLFILLPSIQNPVAFYDLYLEDHCFVVLIILFSLRVKTLHYLSPFVKKSVVCSDYSPNTLWMATDCSYVTPFIPDMVICVFFFFFLMSLVMLMNFINLLKEPAFFPPVSSISLISALSLLFPSA